MTTIIITTIRTTGVCCYNLSKNFKSVDSLFDLDTQDVYGSVMCNIAANLIMARSSDLYANSSKDQ